MIKSEKRSRLALTAGTESEQDGGSAEMPPLKRRYRVSGYPNALFDPEKSLNCLAKMIILHDYPLHIVEQPAFVAFVESLNPRFKVLDVGSMEGEILAIYQREKDNLVQVFFSCSLCIPDMYIEVSQ